MKSDPCLLCGEKSGGGILGIFRPNNQKRFGAPEGKTRFLLYRVCWTCSDRPGWEQRVEDELVFKAEDLYQEVMHKKREEAIRIMEDKLIEAYSLGKKAKRKKRVPPSGDTLPVK